MTNATKILSVRLTDPHQPSTIVTQLAHLVNNEESVAQFILNERTSIFLSMDGKIAYFESRIHSLHGAVVVSGSKLKLDNFCSYIWNLEAEEECGNLVLEILEISSTPSYPDA